MPPRRSTRNKTEDKPPKKDVESEEEESEEEEDAKKTTKGKKGGKTAAKAQSKAKGKAKKDESEDESEDGKKSKGKKGKGKAAAKGKRKADESDEEESDDDKKPSKKLKGDDGEDKKVTKVVTKGGVAVDKHFPVDGCHVYIDGNTVYNKTLNQTNIGANSNKFYMIQVLESDTKKNEFYTWNRWGRVGYDGQTSLKKYSDAASAIKDFNKKHHDKTVKGDYVEIDISYSDDEDDKKADDKSEDEDDKKGKKGKKVTKKAAKKDESEEEEDEEEEEEEKEEPKEKVKKVTAKGGAVVDEYFNEPDCTVYMDDKKVYNSILNQSNIANNNNKFYVIQILESNKNKGTYFVWNRWGRVGVAGQNAKKKFTDINSAIAEYEKKLHEKTVKGDYVVVDIKYDEEEEEETKDEGDQKEDEKKSKLPTQVKDLVKLIFDLKMMNTQMKEIGYDPSQMPLGKLSKSAIQKGYELLNQLSDAIKKKKGQSTLNELCNKFYSYIPHDVKFAKMSNFLLDTEEKVKKKLELLSSLEEIQIATKLIGESSKGGEEALVDTHYAKLNCDITPIEKTSDEFKMIQEYVKNTHASTHASYGLEIVEVFKTVRAGEAERFTKDLHNKQLLWHGSRLTNYVGILSQGLRIAPPEAPVTGYMFGKGVYFADMVSKSANYCFTNSQNPTGLMLLCEVALGNTNDLYYADYNAGNLPAGKHSTKGCGKTAPDPSGAKKIDGDNGEIIVPSGKGDRVNIAQGALLYNEFIVYDIKQIKMKYLLRMKFNHRY